MLKMPIGPLNFEMTLDKACPCLTKGTPQNEEWRSLLQRYRDNHIANIYNNACCPIGGAKIALEMGVMAISALAGALLKARYPVPSTETEGYRWIANNQDAVGATADEAIGLIDAHMNIVWKYLDDDLGIKRHKCPSSDLIATPAMREYFKCDCSTERTHAARHVLSISSLIGQTFLEEIHTTSCIFGIIAILQTMPELLVRPIAVGLWRNKHPAEGTIDENSWPQYFWEAVQHLNRRMNEARNDILSQARLADKMASVAVQSGTVQ